MKGSDAGSVQLTSSSCCVRSDVPAACWECEGKAGLRPRGTSYSPACSAQSLSPCLPVFVERLIKEQSALRGLTTSGSFGADEHGHPFMFPSGVRWGVRECTDPRVSNRETSEQPRFGTWSFDSVHVGTYSEGGSEWWLSLRSIWACQRSAALISNDEGRVELSGAACYFRWESHDQRLFLSSSCLRSFCPCVST